MNNPTRYSQRRYQVELEGYLDAIDVELAQHTSRHLLLPILRLCELLLQHCGPGTLETASLRARVASARLRLDHAVDEDSDMHEVVR